MPLKRNPSIYCAADQSTRLSFRDCLLSDFILEVISVANTGTVVKGLENYRLICACFRNNDVVIPLLEKYGLLSNMMLKSPVGYKREWDLMFYELFKDEPRLKSTYTRWRLVRIIRECAIRGYVCFPYGYITQCVLFSTLGAFKMCSDLTQVRPPIRTGIYAKIAKIHHSENSRICLLSYGGILGKLIEKINLNIIKIHKNIYKILRKVPSKIIKYVETTRLVENSADTNYTDALALIKTGNCAKAEKLLQMAISKRHAKAIPMLVSLLINDRRNLIEQVPKCLISLGINFGCLDCFALDAYLKEEYYDSIEVSLDALKTAQYCANSGSMFGKYALACIVYKGIPNHLEPDYCLAYRLFIETAEFIPDASLNAALLKKDGRGTHIDLNGSFELMLRSATQGNEQAIYWTAVNYYESIGVEKCIKLAIYWCSLIKYDSYNADVLMRRLKQDEIEASQA